MNQLLHTNTLTRVKTHYLLQVVKRREQCCVAPSEQCCAATMFCCTLWTMLCWSVNNVVLHPVNNVVLHPVNNVVNKVVQPWKQCCYSIVQLSMLLQLVDKVEQHWMITITNKLVLSILFSPVSTTVSNRCCFINAEQHCWNYSEQHCSFDNIVQPW